MQGKNLGTLKTPIKNLFSHLLNFIYPPYCLHCDAPFEGHSKIFCSKCLESLRLIDPMERCLYCFSPEIGAERSLCSACCQNPPPWNRAAAAIDYEGSAISLIKAMKYGNQPHLAKSAAALITAQFLQLDWPFPDLIVPVPIPWTRWIQRGYNQSSLLAQEIGKMINRPVCKALKRKSGDFSQASLSLKKRLELDPSSFYLVKKKKIEDKTILLIDDVMTTGSTLKCCARVLLDGFPCNIYVLTVCHAIP